MSFDETEVAIITIICALIHEGGHIIALLFFSEDKFKLRGVASGFRITKHRLSSYRAEILVYLSGPMLNLFFSIFPFLLLPYHSEHLSTFSLLNLATALSNLLPVEGYDGYGALRCLLLSRSSEFIAEKVLPLISFLLILSLCVFSIYFIDRFAEGYWVFFIFSGALIKKLDSALKNSKSEI